MKFLIVLILVLVLTVLYIRFKNKVNPHILKYKKLLYEFLQAFTSWAAFKKMLYGAELPPKIVAPPVASLAKRRTRRIRISPAKLHQEVNGYDILHRKDAIESLEDDDKNEHHPRAFELALLLNAKDAKVKKSNKQNMQQLQKKKPIKLDEPSAFNKSKSSANSLNRDK